jgi:hypothetical protein
LAAVFTLGGLVGLPWTLVLGTDSGGWGLTPLTSTMSLPYHTRLGCLRRPYDTPDGYLRYPSWPLVLQIAHFVVSFLSPSSPPFMLQIAASGSFPVLQRAVGLPYRAELHLGDYYYPIANVYISYIFSIFFTHLPNL